MFCDNFASDDVAMVKAYRKASELRDRRNNQDMWLQGRYFYDALCASSPLYRFTMKKGMIKPEPYTKEPYPTTHAELLEREEREKRDKEERLKAEFTAFVNVCVRNHPILDIFLIIWYNIGVKSLPR